MKKLSPLSLYLLATLTLFSTQLNAQGTLSSNRDGSKSWNTNPFESKLFIENRGQFDGCNQLPGSQIYYGIQNLGTEIFFTSKGLSYRFDQREVLPEKESERERERERGGKEYKDDLKKRLKITTHLVHMEWQGANSDVKIVVEDKADEYFSYPTNVDGKGLSYVPGYKKLKYIGLYPGIDVEYTFHQKEGIKYALIVHPGADPSVVKMNYSGANKVSLDNEGKIHLKLPIGDIIDHAPLSFFADGEAVSSAFSLQGNTVTFSLTLTANQKSKINNQKLIIDPWNVSPGLTGNNRAYDIAKDVFGNVFVYGGSSKFTCKKLNPANGATVWTYSATALDIYYGDMALDFFGNVYLSDGCCNGQIVKLNNNAVIQWTKAKDNDFYELWRMAMDCNYKYLIVGGGPYSIATYKQIASVDMNTGALINLSLFGGKGELRSLALDPLGQVYSLFVLGWGTSAADNQVVKGTNNFTQIYSVTSNYNLFESGINYTSTGSYAGFNGIVINTKYIYTYDGATLWKKNLATGANISNVAVPGAGVNQCSGICLDYCGNVYVGTLSSIRKYDSSLTFLTSVATTAAVYDLVPGVNNEMLACGNGWAASLAGLNVCIPSMTLNATSTGNGCGGGNNGTATVSASGGIGPYTYNWSPGNQTTATATGLSGGTYTVTVTDFNGCNGGIQTQTVVVTGSGGGLVYNTTANNPLCNGGAGTATASATTGTSPYTYSWSSGGQTTQTATGLSAGTYTVLVTDATGCSSTKAIVVTQPPALNAAASGVNATCTVLGSATASGSGGTGGFAYSWSAGGQTTQTVSGLSAGVYTVKITDVNGCTQTATVNITGAPGPGAGISTSTNPTCFGFNNGSATVTATGGSGSYTYAWAPNGGTGATGTSLSAGTYTVTVTDNNGCTSTATVTLTQPAAVVPGVTNTSNVSCNGGSNGVITLTTGGGTGSYTYAWSNGQTNANATGLSAGNYSVTVTDANGCTGTASAAITEPTALTVTANGINACSNATATSNAAGGTPNYNYAWNNGQTTANATGLTTGTYTLVVTDANGCTASDTAIINVSPPPIVTFTADDTAGCAPLCVNLTCTSVNIATYTWDFGDGSANGSGSPVNHCYKNPGTYSVTLTVKDNNGCTATLVKNNYISVFPNVLAAFSAAPQPTTILNPIITFTDLSTGGANTWSWTFFDDGATSTLQNPKHTYKDSGCFNVELIANNIYNCPDTTKEQICILGDYELFAPNAFTPDGSGLNDVWNVRGIGIDPNHFKLWIFDRWGNLIFETSDLFQGWNGHANGGREIAQQDVYVWKVATRDFQGGKHQYIGHVSLVR